jgi:hypothetical protein
LIALCVAIIDPADVPLPVVALVIFVTGGILFARAPHAAAAINRVMRHVCQAGRNCWPKQSAADL